MVRRSSVLIALGMAFAIACGGSADVTTSAAGTTAEQTEAPGTPAPDAAPRVKDGDTVRVHYTGTLETGEEFDSSRQPGREPLEFVVGSGQVIAGFDDAVRGLAEGETRTQRIEPEDGYGLPDPALIQELPLEQLPPDVVVGQELISTTGQRATIVSIDESARTATVDFNHFLAGEVLIFDVELVEVIPAG